MRLTALDIRDVRIIARAAIEPGPVNLIIGPNAAGKTSLLESIHLLGTGRSFAASRPDRLIRHEGGPLRVVARLESDDGGLHRLGVERGWGGPWRVRLDGATVSRVADLARALPLLVVHPGSHEILAGGPAERRGLLDWGLFHVEHPFHAAWQRYRRALAQRNHLLRRGAREAEITAWNPELVASAEVIDGYRRGYVDELARYVDRLGSIVLREPMELELAYRPGWPVGTRLDSALAERLESDRSLKTTTAGPHRAEFQVRTGGRDSRQRISRGQQKLLIYLLRLAQAEQLVERTGRRPVLLFDDPAAELDRDHQARVLAASLDSGAQLFVTALDAAQLALPENTDFRTFHVEQGRVQEVI